MRGILSAVVLCLVCAGVQAAVPEKKELVKKLAQALGEAMRKGDAGAIVDSTYEPVIADGGGREKAVELIKKGLMELRIVEFGVGAPSDFHTGGTQTFVVVPTSMTIEVASGVQATIESYLLGISADDGATWKFVEGAGLEKEDERKKFLPNLPDSLKLPDLEKPTIVK